MIYQNILTEQMDKVALITLNRPEKLNAMSYELALELDAELAKLENDDAVNAVVLTGALWTGQFILVAAAGGRYGQGQRAALYGTSRQGRRS
jgi:1,4-dihydroxy-2-naphthoyl-CoA synthase